jgi:hypothetical protein
MLMIGSNSSNFDNRRHWVGLERRWVCWLIGLICGLTTNLSFLLGQSRPEGVRFFSTNLQAFGIPYQINSNEESLIEVQLYVSLDQGKTWQFVDRQGTDQREFRFQSRGDAEYWFGLKTLNRNRQLVPAGNLAPGLIVVVDTVPPEFDFQVSTDAAGRVECRWRATDRNLSAESLKLEYQSLQTIGQTPPEWQEVPVNLAGTVRNGIYADRIAWWPETSDRMLRIRGSIADFAGNRVEQERTVTLAATPWRHRNEATAHRGLDISSGMGIPAGDPFSPSAVPGGMAEGRATARRPPLAESQLEPPTPSPTQSPSRSGGSAAQLWQSEAEHLTAPQHTQSSTVRGPTPNPENAPARPRLVPDSIAEPNSNFNFNSEQPQSPTATLPGSSALPPSNPAISAADDRHVISQSSTAGPVNQYRGPVPLIADASPPAFTAGVLVDRGVEEDAGNWIAGDIAGGWANSGRSEGDVGAAGVPSSTSNFGLNPRQFSQPKTNAAEVGAEAFHQLARSQPFGQDSIPRPEGNPYQQVANPSQQSVVESDSASPVDASVQMIGSQRFRLNYGIDAIDPSGVARVDLWMTRDDGRTWQSWGTDPDNVSPFPVEVEEEGRYGFRIVVHSRDGLTGRGPANGEKPDVLVQVDTQAPLAQIVSVPYGRGTEAGRLIINYRVADPHLTLRPVSLFYSAAPEGPWLAVEEGLRNEGRYAWKPDGNVPDRIFLKLEAIDRAGNRGVHQLNQAIDVSGLVPRGTIHSVVPVAPR